MSKPNPLSFLSVSVLALGLSISASANTITVSAGPFSPTAGLSTVNFDNGLMPANFVTSGTGVGVVSGSLNNVYSAPTGDSTPYAYVGPNSSLTINYASAIKSFGLYWGSIDSYNAVAFTDMNGVVTTYGDNGISLAGTLMVDQKSAAYVTFLDSGAAWKSVKLTSSSSAFEFDNISTASATPEPATFTCMAGGLLAVAVGIIRRRKVSL